MLNTTIAALKRVVFIKEKVINVVFMSMTHSRRKGLIPYEILTKRLFYNHFSSSDPAITGLFY